MNELQKRFKVGLDEVFEDSQSYVGVMSPEDHLFESVLSFTLDFFQAEITDMLDRVVVILKDAEKTIHGGGNGRRVMSQVIEKIEREKK